MEIAMTTAFRSRFAKFVAVLVATGAITAQASAASLTVKLACANDYYAFCSQHSPGSLGVRKCMRAHGSQLSGRCINALIGAGEVSKVEVERRRAVRLGKAKSVAAN
jgi:hypothetical protein